MYHGKEKKNKEKQALLSHYLPPIVHDVQIATQVAD
jgi:hypothetical protein